MKEEKYNLYIEDRFHQPLSTEAEINEYRWVHQTCNSYDEAVKSCEAYCDNWCEAAFKVCKTESEFCAYYYHHGEDVWISEVPEGKERFSTDEYIEKKAKLHYN